RRSKPTSRWASPCSSATASTAVKNCCAAPTRTSTRPNAAAAGGPSALRDPAVHAYNEGRGDGRSPLEPLVMSLGSPIEQRVVMPAASRVRPAAVAGTFYPAEPAKLREAVQRYTGEAATTLAERGEPAQPRWPKAIIGPHAGYPFSGPTAGFSYARLRAARGFIKRVVLIGPAHRVPVPALATTSADAFATPLGMVRVDR